VWRKLLESRSDISRLNAATFSDIPGNSGLGSSSAFTVAAISALDMYLDQEFDINRISSEAIKVERFDLVEPGGWQDQLHATYGGFRLYTFKGENVVVGEELLTFDEMKSLNESSILVKIGESRQSGDFHSFSNDVMQEEYNSDLKIQAELALHAAKILSSDLIWSLKFDSICELMLENWRIKKSISNRSSNGIDELISFGLKNGAKSAKLCGAGGSGYVLFLGDPDGIMHLRKKIDIKSLLEFKFDSFGAKAINV
jgi:D-glycero-alpha-D-manno-heptose-7-phosphate kinase